MLDFLALVVAVVMMNWERVEKLSASSGSGSHSKCKRVCQSDCKKTCAIILSLQTNISFALSAFLCVQGAEVCVLCECVCVLCVCCMCVYAGPIYVARSVTVAFSCILLLPLRISYASFI